MTIRRKFFPLKTVQKEPGRTVELSVQLHRNKAPAPMPECDIFGACWSVHLLPLWSELHEDGENVWIAEDFYIGGHEIPLARYQGTPHTETYMDSEDIEQTQVLEGPELLCTHLRIQRPFLDSEAIITGIGGVLQPVLLGTLLGNTMTKVEWQFGWNPASPIDTSHSLVGDYALTAGNGLWVYPAFLGSDQSVEDIQLQATAYCAEKPVAQLELIIVGFEI